MRRAAQLLLLTSLFAATGCDGLLTTLPETRAELLRQRTEQLIEDWRAEPSPAEGAPIDDAIRALEAIVLTYPVPTPIASVLPASPLPLEPVTEPNVAPLRDLARSLQTELRNARTRVLAQPEQVVRLSALAAQAASLRCLAYSSDPWVNQDEDRLCTEGPALLASADFAEALAQAVELSLHARRRGAMELSELRASVPDGTPLAAAIDARLEIEIQAYLDSIPDAPEGTPRAADLPERLRALQASLLQSIQALDAYVAPAPGSEDEFDASYELVEKGLQALDVARGASAELYERSKPAILPWERPWTEPRRPLEIISALERHRAQRGATPGPGAPPAALCQEIRTRIDALFVR